jgi:hypothetical protein
MPSAQDITHTRQIAEPPRPETHGTQRNDQSVERSLEFQTTGSELPQAVYIVVIAAFAWIVVMAWFAFGHGIEAEWLATVGVLIGIVFFGIPILLWHANRAARRAKRRDLDEFLHSSFETATGRLRGWDAYIQVLMIPLCLALAATVFGSIWLWVS